MTARELALKALYEIDINGSYVNAALSEALGGAELDSRDRALVTELIYGTVSNRIAIDYVISRFSKIRLKKLSPWVLNILRMGVFQMLYMDKIPHSAVCNEAVKLAKRYSHKAGSGFVNGVLRSFSREKNNFEFPKTGSFAEQLSIEYSYPLWMTEKIIQEYGEEKCKELFQENRKAHSPTIRVNTLKTTKAELKTILDGEGITYRDVPELENCMFVDGGLSVNHSKAYKDGFYSLQNISSYMATLELSPKANETVIDMCAAPGGKTCSMAEMMGNKGKIIAFDIFEHKIELIKNAAKRLGIDIIDARLGDSCEVDEILIEKADKVLADVPCSGLGVIHKKPDIKFSREAEDIAELTKIQEKILETAASYLKHGGTLVYSTCTILPEENRMRIESFLKEHKEFKIVSENQLLTDETGRSGFYICKMLKE